MTQRIIAAWYLTGQDEHFPAVNFNAFNRSDPETNAHIDVQDDHYKYDALVSCITIVCHSNLTLTWFYPKARSRDRCSFNCFAQEREEHAAASQAKVNRTNRV